MSILWLLILPGLAFFWTLLGYKLFLRHGSHQAPGAVPTSTRPAVSVLVPCYNESRVLQSKIESTLAELQVQGDQLIVIDDGSTDESLEKLPTALSGDARVTIIRQPRAGKNSAINAGVIRAKNEWLVITDANASLDPGSLLALLSFSSQDKTGIIRGQYLPASEHSLFHQQAGNFRTQEHEIFQLEAARGVLNISGGWLQAIRREIIDTTEQRTMVEDWDLTLRAITLGYSVGYAQTAIARKRTATTPHEIYSQNVRYIYGSLQTAWKYRKLLWPKTNSFLWLALWSGKISQALIPFWILFTLTILFLQVGILTDNPMWMSLVIFGGAIFCLGLFLVVFNKTGVSFFSWLTYLVSIISAGFSAYVLIIVRRGRNWTGWQPAASTR